MTSTPWEDATLTEGQTGKVRRDGELVMAAAPNSVILGLPSDVEEVINADDKDHSDIVKFERRSDETYQNVKVRIQDLVSGQGREGGCW
jgi:hypothetical protein